VSGLELIEWLTVECEMRKIHPTDSALILVLRCVKDLQEITRQKNYVEYIRKTARTSYENPRVIFTCEWCEPSDIPEKKPEICRVLDCPRHGRCWFWPKEKP